MAVQNYALNLGLNDVPDDSLDPEVWAELNKVFLAAKALASALDSGTNPGIANTPGSTVTIQNYSKVYRSAPFFIPAGSVVEFFAATTQLTSGSYPYPSGFAEADIPANTIGEIIILGMVYYAPGGLIPGTRYYVNNSAPGAITSAAGGRFVGQAFAPNVLYFEPVRS